MESDRYALLEPKASQGFAVDGPGVADLERRAIAHGVVQHVEDEAIVFLGSFAAGDEDRLAQTGRAPGGESV